MSIYYFVNWIMPLGSVIQRNDEWFNQDDDEDFYFSLLVQLICPISTDLEWNILFPFAETGKYWDRFWALIPKWLLEFKFNSRSLMMTFFGYKKALLAQVCALQSIAEHVLTFFKRKRSFLHRFVFFKAKLNTCSSF